MPDFSKVVPGDDERGRRVDRVRTWCEECRVTEQAPPLTDRAALLIASGRVDDQCRTVVFNRLASGRTFPTFGGPGDGGYGQLRAITAEIAWLDRRVASLRTGPTRFALTQRRTLLTRRLATYESAFELSTRHFARGVRAIRKDRRDGVHLETEQRRMLFGALLRTPAPTGAAGPFGRAIEVVAEVAAERLEPVGRGLSDMARSAAGVGEMRFADRFETLLFLAGSAHDRIVESRMWHSDVFAIQRAQLDPATELVQIAFDAAELEAVDRELTAALDAGDSRDEVGRREILLRKGELVPVWDQMIERVAALRRVVDQLAQAQAQFGSLDAVSRAVNLDGRIGGLISRSGTRELSADNIHNVGDQIERG